jgi:hypothetical protein
LKNNSLLRNIIAGLTFLVAIADVAAQEPNYADLDAVLKRHVQAGSKAGIKANLVNYKAIAGDPAWAAAKKSITDFNPSLLKGRNEKLAFYINAYNVAAISKVLEQYPVASIRAKGDGVWKEPAMTIYGKTYSLDTIENSILRPMKEPRIHFAIVCASLSCPDLRRQAYTGKKVQSQLHSQTASFLGNKSKGIRIEGKTVHETSIFKWFSADFGNVEAFQKRYVKTLPAGATHAEIPYNWSLNGL